MSKTSPTLRRLGVGVASLATVAAGLTAVAPFANAATTDISGLSIAPTAAATSTGENQCQWYTLTATESGTNTGGTVQVNLTPSGAVDSEFCDSTASHGPFPTGTSTTAQTLPYNPSATPGTEDTAYFTLDANNQVTFGVDEANATPVAGQIQVQAYPFNSASTATPPGPATGAPVANALQTIQTADSQNNLVTSLTASPGTQTATVGQTATYKLTATDGTNVVMGAGPVTYTVTSSQGNPTGVSGTCDSTQNGAGNNASASGGDPSTDQNGVLFCDVQAPPTIGSVQTGPYTVTFHLAQTTNNGLGTGAATAGQTATAQLNTIAQAPSGSTVSVTCADPHFGPSNCVQPTSATTEVFTAHVVQPTTGGGTAPASGVEVDWSNNNTSTASVSPTSCVTDANGACSTTLTRTGSGVSPTYTVTATVHTTGGATAGSATVQFTDTPTTFTTNITTSPPTTPGTIGQSVIITAKTTDQYGNSANGCNGDFFGGFNSYSQFCATQVTFTISGVGTFSNGTTQQVVPVAPNGTAQVAVTSAVAGTSTVTASIDPNSTSCQQPAGSSTQNNVYGHADPNAKAGNCSASSTITWSATGGGNGSCTTAPTINVPRTLHGAGNIRISGVACKGATVSLFQGGVVRRTTTASTTDGSYSVVFEIARTTAFQVRDESNGKLSATGIATVYEAPFVFLGSPRHGVVTVTLKSNPIVSGLRIDLYVVTSGVRHRVAIEHMGSTGSLTFNISAPAATSQRYQAYGFNSRGIAPGWSAVKAVWVHR